MQTVKQRSFTGPLGEYQHSRPNRTNSSTKKQVQTL